MKFKVDFKANGNDRTLVYELPDFMGFKSGVEYIENQFAEMNKSAKSESNKKILLKIQKG